VLWEAFLGLWVQGVEGLILVGALFLLDGRRRERKEKEKRKERRIKITMGKEGLPGAGPSLLAVQQVAAVRCN
jgi:membrane protein implicated in regulation of membrane protease activity